ncbi:PQQ-binding-like beta-propeller repeat protein [Sulfuracidifex metallicus]|uniref:Pyrrolo-quinoline quinone n=2 Tax=Sulfuracidifex metallicus TaxID=47303 RepID=A0A6A9QRP2_SULME|nr:PQQ-binding-like beta-propeller repeat protein [Sulfuracidifex metallicus]MUN29851.1 pyrrolo-quinoline quinone [Sulfuracidifex metallicus DSM 6482 = JCM 9184]WOE51764.1 PQQ-binding-like beta-propeller repeat protein [Sulfuracidifex metallicus DSM 6482 = JCM 9184]
MFKKDFIVFSALTLIFISTVAFLFSNTSEISGKRDFYTEVYMFEGGPDHQYRGQIYSAPFNITLPGGVIVTPTSLVGKNLILFTTSGEIVNNSLDMNACVGGIYAVNADSGKIVWSKTFPNMIMTQPIVVDGIIVVGLGNNMFVNSSFRGPGLNELVALNEQGKILWTHLTKGEAMPTPVFFDGNVITATGGGYVCSVNLMTGETVWVSQISSYVSMSSPLLVNGQVIFGGASPYDFYDINASNGHVIWNVTLNATGGLDDSSPSFYNGIVITGFTYKVNNYTLDYKEVGINFNNGEIVWCLNEGDGDVPPNLESPPATVVNGLALISSPGTPYLYAVNYSNGHVEWKVKTGPDIDNPAVGGNLLFILNQSGYLYVINLQGKVLNVVKTDVIPGPGEPMLTESGIIIWGVNGVVESIPLDKVI